MLTFYFLLHALGLLLGGAGLLATLLPLLRQTAWWIRVFDFPRLQIVAGLLLSLGLLLLPGAPALAHAPAVLLALAAAVLYQATRIWPYTPWHRKQVQDSQRPPHDPTTLACW